MTGRYYKFDYCAVCMHLFLSEELECPNCKTMRFKDNSVTMPMDKQMKDFFFYANLEDIQNSFYQGKIS